MALNSRLKLCKLHLKVEGTEPVVLCPNHVEPSSPGLGTRQCAPEVQDLPGRNRGFPSTCNGALWPGKEYQRQLVWYRFDGLSVIFNILLMIMIVIQHLACLQYKCIQVRIAQISVVYIHVLYICMVHRHYIWYVFNLLDWYIPLHTSQVSIWKASDSTSNSSPASTSRASIQYSSAMDSLPRETRHPPVFTRLNYLFNMKWHIILSYRIITF